jgi:hypothetical protein
MANNQSWEFYQQPYGGTKYPLYWIAGANSAAAPNTTSGVQVKNNQLWLIPFNQMRAVTVDKIGIDLRMKGAAGAKVRLGIYQNNASDDNYPVASS